MYHLVVTEKPSVAQSIAAVIGARQRKDGYLEGNGYLVSWCIGHLVELADPTAYGNFEKWRKEDLPILPDKWQYQISSRTKKQFEVLRSLMLRPDVDRLICATDAGREGELIFRLTYHQSGCRKPFDRLWISSMEDSAIREGFQKLKPSAQYDSLYHAALCRERADWIIGINATRLFSCLYALDSTKYYYQSDVLIDALAAALESNSTVVKNALEAYISANGGTAMPLTDAYGKTKAENLNLGLYLVVETKVPEMVVSTTDPFLVSVPMTSVNGTNATDGGTRWIYDITLYPKNLTGIPSLEKTLRENQNDTGKTDAYAHTGTASAGDTIDYQIISTLPSITSESTFLSCYTFVDTLSKGLTYNKGDVVLEFFTDAACTDSVAKWTENDGKFAVAYNTTDAGESVMTIEMTADGLKEINTSKAVYTEASMVNSGYSDCTLRITYAAKMDSSADVVFGDTGNDNKVALTWKRSSQNYYDTLVDDCHVFSYGIDLTKLFSDGKGDFSKVEFLIQNKTDNYFVKAELNEDEGVYYVVDHVTDKADATHFVPVKTADSKGKIILKGLEDDTYTMTEVRTDSGYVMLKQGIDVVISKTETTGLCDIYESDVLGLIQNDPRYAEIIKDTGDLKNMPQKHLEHKLMTASATVDGKKVNMVEDNGSINAEAPLTVVNTRGFDLPKTGDHGTWMYSIGGVLLMAVAASAMFFALRKKGSVN